MLTRLFVFGATVALINIVTETSAQYDTYEVYEVYPQSNNNQPQKTQQYYQPQTQQKTQQYYQPQTQQNTQQYYQPQTQQNHYTPQKTQPSYNQNPYQSYPNTQHTYKQQQNSPVTVSEAEWICTNPKTNDMMIIATDDLGSRNNGPVQWHQVNPTNNQPNYVQPQPTFSDPTISPVNPVYTNKPQVNPTTETYTTTEREQGPVWPSGDDVTTKKPVYTTTPQSVRPVWPSGDQNKNNNEKKGFTVEDKPTTERPFFVNPFFDPTTHKLTTTSTTANPEDDDGPIEIVMGK